MDSIAVVDALIHLVSAGAFGFVAWGAWLVATGGRFHRDAPEDACHPHLDLSGES